MKQLNTLTFKNKEKGQDFQICCDYKKFGEKGLGK